MVTTNKLNLIKNIQIMIRQFGDYVTVGELSDHETEIALDDEGNVLVEQLNLTTAEVFVYEDSEEEEKEFLFSYHVKYEDMEDDEIEEIHTFLNYIVFKLIQP
jgi:hypothetical protein